MVGCRSRCRRCLTRSMPARTVFSLALLTASSGRAVTAALSGLDAGFEETQSALARARVGERLRLGRVSGYAKSRGPEGLRDLTGQNRPWPRRSVKPPRRSEAARRATLRDAATCSGMSITRRDSSRRPSVSRLLALVGKWGTDVCRHAPRRTCQWARPHR